MSKNTLIIMSDEHSRKCLGFDGDRVVQTPHIDGLAARGTNFPNAYCNSPICVPSRASLHTGLYPHQIGYWDNAMPFDGRISTWGHALREAGQSAISIGKLHFRDAECDTGFSEQILPLHVKDGIGDPSTLLRLDPPPRPDTAQMAAMAGKGVTPYWDYDVSVAEAAAKWIQFNGRRESGWTLFVSFVLPHFPLNAPEQFKRLYEREGIELPKEIHSYVPENRTLAAMRGLLNFQDNFTSDSIIREAVANYYGLCSALDENIGKVLNALTASGAEEETTIIYSSDHGDNLGARGFWGKSTMWEESVGVPLIISGPGLPRGETNPTPVSLIDLYPTVLDLAGLEPDTSRPGESLVDLIDRPDADRLVFAEYHAVGAQTGTFMIRGGRWKLIEFVGDSPLLYDLETDPEESHNLAADPGSAEILARCRQLLHEIVDPDLTNGRAFADQARMADLLGGEEAIRKIKPLAFTPPN